MKDLKASRFWDEGPKFLLQDEENWPIKFSYKTEKLQDESVKEDVNVILTQDPETDVVNILALRSSSWKRVIRVTAWMLRFRGYKGGTQLSTSLDCNEISKDGSDEAHSKKFRRRIMQQFRKVQKALANERYGRSLACGLQIKKICPIYKGCENACVNSILS